MTTMVDKTNYEALVSPRIRSLTEDLMRSWREEGRDDDRIEHLVQSCVLAAYAAGKAEAIREEIARHMNRTEGV